jgi:RHS repeat-associated protein
VTKDFLWDPASSPQRLLAATTSSSTDRVIYGNGPLYLLRGAAQDSVALVTDGQGSIRAEVNASQQVTGSWRYELYGKVAQSSGAASPAVLAYTGQLLDPTGLYFLRARWYDPMAARFTSRDPLGGSGGTAFGYAGGDPLRLIDPTGWRETTGTEESDDQDATVEPPTPATDPSGPVEDCNNGNKCSSGGDGGGGPGGPPGGPGTGGGSGCCGGSLPKTELARESVAIGETQARVEAFADRIAAKTYQEAREHS